MSTEQDRIPMTPEQDQISKDILGYLEQHQQKELLRFVSVVAVSVEKKTLIGRLLHDTHGIYEDQLASVKRASGRAGMEIDFSLFTDGLRAEREQGITIDVAYKYFSTAKRKFIIADAPGHIQYTRNMVTGASNSELAIILVDARHGVVEQTRRHSVIASLLHIPHIVVAINKMDLVHYSQDVYHNTVIDYQQVAASLGLQDVKYIPISALNGDNIVDTSENLSWYEGESLLQYLENIQLDSDVNLTDARFSVQYVIRPQSEELHDYRGYAGKVISGIYRKGDKVTILPSGIESTIKAIEIGGKEIEEAYALQSVVLHLEDDVD